jgi:single-stranded-DNA-specific exonuclease
VLEPRFDWRIPEPLTISPSLAAAAADVALPVVAVEVLARRGLVDPDDLRDYAAQDPRAGLGDHRRLPDADRAADRLARARERREGVLVVGDFDADGLTGMALLARALRACGLTVGIYVPARVDEGHGLSMKAIETARGMSATLIVTVDTGTSSVAEIRQAARLGLDVVVTDHHRVGSELPPAVAVVNPHRPDATYPDRRLAGSGVALKVAQLATAELLGMDPALVGARLADLAVIGTVSDVAPIVGENRAIARLGLERIRSAPRPGIAALLARSGVTTSTVGLDSIAFAIAPRLNAAGRVGEAHDAANLLLTQDPAEAERLADVLEIANTTRRDLLRMALVEARASAEADPLPGLVMILGSWPVGIIGLIAGRLADELRRPAIVGSRLDGTIRASARGDGVLDLAAALDAASDLLVRHGGHRAAAGFEVRASDWMPLRERLATAAASLPSTGDRDVLDIDLAVSSARVDHRLLADLGALEPTGPGNPTPIIAIEGLTVVRVRAVTGGHTQLTLRRSVDVLDAIAFGREDLVGALAVDERVDVVATLGSRSFAGLDTMQLEVRDVATTGTHAASSAMAAAIARRGAVGVAQ